MILLVNEFHQPQEMKQKIISLDYFYVYKLFGRRLTQGKN
jgi:hypothetical protein